MSPDVATSVRARLLNQAMRIIAFLGPVRDSIVATAPFVQTWPRGGPWSRGGGPNG
jgi:hypothetical protein